MAQRKKMYTELQGHWGEEELAKRKMEQDTILAKYQTEIAPLNKSEQQQLQNIGIEAFYQIAEVVNAKGNYNDNVDRQFLLNSAFYVGVLENLRKEIHLFSIQESKDMLRTISQVEKSLEFNLKTLGLTPQERVKVLENNEGNLLNVNEEDLKEILNDINI